jgi:hypothetical protein
MGLGKRGRSHGRCCRTDTQRVLDRLSRGPGRQHDAPRRFVDARRRRTRTSETPLAAGLARGQPFTRARRLPPTACDHGWRTVRLGCQRQSVSPRAEIPMAAVGRPPTRPGSRPTAPMTSSASGARRGTGELAPPIVSGLELLAHRAAASGSQRWRCGCCVIYDTTCAVIQDHLVSFRFDSGITPVLLDSQPCGYGGGTGWTGDRPAMVQTSFRRKRNQARSS